MKAIKIIPKNLIGKRLFFVKKSHILSAPNKDAEIVGKTGTGSTKNIIIDYVLNTAENMLYWAFNMPSIGLVYVANDIDAINAMPLLKNGVARIVTIDDNFDPVQWLEDTAGSIYHKVRNVAKTTYNDAKHVGSDYLEGLSNVTKAVGKGAGDIVGGVASGLSSLLLPVAIIAILFFFFYKKFM